MVITNILVEDITEEIELLDFITFFKKNFEVNFFIQLSSYNLRATMS